MDSSRPVTVETAATSSATSPVPAPARKGSSPLRLGILLLVLAILIAALAYDNKVAKPASEAANTRIQQYIESRNQKSVKESGAVTSADIQKELGRAPTWVEKEPTYTVEWYCWWGKVPLLSSRRHYITVLYVGDERRFSTQYLNAPPADDDLPTHFLVGSGSNPLEDLENLEKAAGSAPSGPPPGMGMPGMSGMGPGMGPPRPGMGGMGMGKGKGKGKGKGGAPGSPEAAPQPAGEAPLPALPAAATPAGEETTPAPEKPAAETSDSDDKTPPSDKPTPASEGSEKPASESKDEPAKDADQPQPSEKDNPEKEPAASTTDEPK